MLNEQLQKQIEQEANKSASRLFNTHSRFIARTEYALGAERYAALWQAAEEKAARYEKALNYITTFKLTSELEVVDLSVIEYGYNAIIETAREALTPKTSEDEKP